MTATLTGELLARLRRHYIKPGPMPGGVFLPECGWNGHTGSRCDALYVGFTSTSGRLLVGHELKVSRSDWRRELDQPHKAGSWADQCHAWYVVAPSTEVVPVEEVPSGWGLMVPDPRTKTRMKTLVKANVNRDRTPSWQAVRSIMARLDTLQAQDAERVKREALDEARVRVEREADRRRQYLTSEQRDRLQALDRLEERLGCKLDAWVFRDDGQRVDAGRLAAALRLVETAEHLPQPFEIQAAIRAAAKAGEALASIAGTAGELQKVSR